MRKILLIFTFILFSTLVYAGPNDKINESGFINKEVRLIKNFEIKDPKNKIILIYNHGQDENDTSPNCTWVSMLRNHASLIDQEVNGKKIMVYNLCSNHLRGDMSKNMSKKKDWWYLKPRPKIYEGKHMLDKRVELNLKLIETRKSSISYLKKQNIFQSFKEEIKTLNKKKSDLKKNERQLVYQIRSCEKSIKVLNKEKLKKNFYVHKFKCNRILKFL